MLSSRLRLVVDRALDGAGDLADRNPAFARWRSERFSEQVVRRMPGLAVDAAHGVRYFVRPQDSAIGAAIIRYGAFEPHKVTAVLTLLRAHGVEINHVVDVGANIGTTTIELLRQMPEVSATAFEPEPTNFLLLQMNLIANRLEQRVRAQQAAIGDATGELTLELADSNFGDHRVRVGRSIGEGAFGETARRTIRVPGLRLDDVEKLSVDERTLVFVDVQGFEGHVLTGARRVLECRPPLVVELWPYGLDRSGGREAMFNELARYERLYDVGAAAPRLVMRQELEALAESVIREPTGHTDLLALAV
jgi:FkbM family methyltransferase